jgi:hypothetical protein
MKARTLSRTARSSGVSSASRPRASCADVGNWAAVVAWREVWGKAAGSGTAAGCQAATWRPPRPAAGCGYAQHGWMDGYMLVQRPTLHGQRPAPAHLGKGAHEPGRVRCHRRPRRRRHQQLVNGLLLAVLQRACGKRMTSGVILTGENEKSHATRPRRSMHSLACTSALPSPAHHLRMM